MQVYAYQAALLCADCGQRSIRDLAMRGIEDSEDSDDYPQGPYPNGGGESDTPEHCDHCGLFLENPLTGEGYDYVQECWNGPTADSECVREWIAYYGMEDE